MKLSRAAEIPPDHTELKGYTLLELLAVMGIVSLIICMIPAAFNSIATGSKLTQAGQLLGDQIALARQEATSKNRDVEVRILQVTTGPSQGWRGVQIWRNETGTTGSTTSIPVTRMMLLPTGIVISGDNKLSPMLDSTQTTGEVNLPGSVSRAHYSGFRIRANGSIESSVNWTNNFVTLRNQTAPDNNLKDYYVIQVNPITAKVIAYRP